MRERIQHGTVQSYRTHRNGRQFGFILANDGTQVFFHMNMGRHVTAARNGPVFTHQGVHRTPHAGDPVIFVPRQSKRGIRTRVWGFASEWTSAIKEVAERGTQPSIN